VTKKKRGRDRVGMRATIDREKNEVATICKKNEQTESSEENHLVTTTFVGRGFRETKKTDEV
jgi:hypothetical protein